MRRHIYNKSVRASMVKVSPFNLHPFSAAERAQAILVDSGDVEGDVGYGDHYGRDDEDFGY